MDSLGKLIDGRGRGVVHQLIPQLRILDGSHFSGGEGDLAVDAQLLDEADDLICEGASRARAAWAEEDAAEEMEAANQWEREAAGERSPGSPSASSRRRRRREGVVAAAAGVDGGGSQQQAEDRGMVHWDSDLTQGGRQALSGNPRCVCVTYLATKNTGQDLACSIWHYSMTSFYESLWPRGNIFCRLQYSTGCGHLPHDFAQGGTRLY